MSGPWYECAGPTAEAVRKDVYKYISSYNIGRIKYQKEKDKIIQEALHEIIPNSRNDFGSWRGYATFGVMQQVAGEVMKEIRLKYSLFHFLCCGLLNEYFLKYFWVNLLRENLF